MTEKIKKKFVKFLKNMQKMIRNNDVRGILIMQNDLNLFFKISPVDTGKKA